MPEEKQLVFDFDLERPRKRMLLEEMIIARFEFEGRQLRQCSIGNMKSLLIMIEKMHGTGGRPRIKNRIFARKMNWDVRMLQRTKKLCVQAGLLKVEESSSKNDESATTYEIQWPEVYQRILDNPITEPLINMERLYHRDRSKPSYDKSRGSCDKSRGSCDNSGSFCDNSNRSCDNSYDRTVVRTSSSRARSKPSEPSVNQLKEPLSKKGGLETEPEKAEAGKREFGGWPIEVTPIVLSTSFGIQRLWMFALANFGLTVEMRIPFFGTAIDLVRQHREAQGSPIENFGAVFTHRVKNRSWHGCDAQEARAREMINQVDGRSRPPAAYNPHVIPR